MACPSAPQMPATTSNTTTSKGVMALLLRRRKRPSPPGRAGCSAGGRIANAVPAPPPARTLASPAPAGPPAGARQAEGAQAEQGQAGRFGGSAGRLHPAVEGEVVEGEAAGQVVVEGDDGAPDRQPRPGELPLAGAREAGRGDRDHPEGV